MSAIGQGCENADGVDEGVIGVGLIATSLQPQQGLLEETLGRNTVLASEAGVEGAER